MLIAIEEVAVGITKVALEGRMDIAGAEAADLKMNVAAGSAKNLLIDLEKLSFLGSMGLRSIVVPARAVLARGGKVAIYTPTEIIEKVFQSSGLNTVLPVFKELDAALASLQ